LKESEESDQLKWFVPLTWTTESKAPAGFESTHPEDWILPNDTTKELNIETNPDEWIIFNNQETGVQVSVLCDCIILQLVEKGTKAPAEGISFTVRKKHGYSHVRG
jgi:hypothetical protein